MRSSPPAWPRRHRDARPEPARRRPGRGAAAAAGIAVEFGPGGGEARELNIGFVSRMERGRPWLRLKAAVSLDGRTALADGTSQWITGEAARADGHAWRKRAGAVLTGVGTVLDDDPRLDVRLCPTARQPLRVIVDSRLETPPTARILAAARRGAVYAAVDDAARRRALEARGAEVALLPSPAGKVDLAAMLADLGRRGINELHVEAGEKLNASLLAARPGRRVARLRRAAPARQRPRPGGARRRSSGSTSLELRSSCRARRRRPAARRPAPRASPPLTPSRRRGARAARTIGACSPASSAASAAIVDVHPLGTRRRRSARR